MESLNPAEHVVLSEAEFNAINGGGDKTLSYLNKMKALMEMERQDEMEQSADLLQEFSFRELEKRNMAITKLMIK